ncbi:proteobacterial dedicated sortase system histidine kinase [Algibacillus agarilyticus]|uniref:proteobacterial dedicated sortase system histidine kinase n=1 Tax=Algibacillus agarilyticus TaxID=2234133 RepID=UPI000DD05304|nr:proteobacterial dedicated sortase system histidine kinase [Algibacillus agarilyticus]
MKLGRFKFGLRFKLLLLSGFLFCIPWLGYEYVWEMEKYLRIGQEKTLMGTVRAVATALHERPKLFDSQASFLPSVQQGRDLYAYPIVDPIRLDGKLEDWRDTQHAITYDEKYILEGKPYFKADSLQFNHMVGKYRDYLYSYFEVTDDNVIYRPKNSLKVDGNDLLQIAFVTPAGDFRRYLITTPEPGWLTPYELRTEVITNEPLRPESRIQGAWLQTAKGYNVELRIPLELLGSQLSFAITDIDTNSTQGSSEKVTMGTANFKQPDQLGTILVPSPEIERILKGLGHSQSRIWIVDQHSRVLAQTGDIKQSEGVWSQVAQPVKQEQTDSTLKRWLTTLYYKILTKPPTDFSDELYDAAQLQGSHINQALKGKAATTWRLTTDKQAVILSAASPIYSDGQVMGVVIAEETTNGIRTLRNQALEKLFNVIIAVMVLGTLALFLFASRISSRIVKLRNLTEQAIDEQGKIINAIEPTRASDEIGDLQRSFGDMVTRLSEYTQYLQGMSGRLSHELRTPVAVVRSSLESLELDCEVAASSVYMTRAKEGVNRLSSILTLMSEATRLEYALQNTEKQHYVLLDVVTGCVEGYKLTYQAVKFEFTATISYIENNSDEHVAGEGGLVEGAPELFAQLFDKLIANAVEFAEPDTVILIKLMQIKSELVLSVSNLGVLLPEEMQSRLFDSMVSVRKGEQQSQPHLGLGLYIARLVAEFHGGQIKIANNATKNGVNAEVTIPLTSG